MPAPFPGFFVGFGGFKTELDNFVCGLTKRAADSRPAAAAIVGANKVGKTRVLETILPAYVRYSHPGKQFVFASIECNFFTSKLGIKEMQEDVYSRVEASLANCGVKYEMMGIIPLLCLLFFLTNLKRQN